MAEFKKLSEVEMVNTISDVANIFIEDGGVVKRSTFDELVSEFVRRTEWQTLSAEILNADDDRKESPKYSTTKKIIIPNGTEYMALDSLENFAGIVSEVRFEAGGDYTLELVESYNSKTLEYYKTESPFKELSDTLKHVTIGENVEKIHKNMFYLCQNLESIDISESVTSIGDEAFYYCTNLKSVTIPRSVTSIGDKAFCECTNLTSINIPESVTSIGVSVFNSCENLTSVNISEGVTSIGDYAFKYCSKLKSVTIPESVTSIGNQAFYCCTILTSVNISEGVTSIGDYAFSSCQNLTSINIPRSVVSIGKPSSGNITYKVYENSYGHTWAVENGKPFTLVT
jgi:hypothetical protein